MGISLKNHAFIRMCSCILSLLQEFVEHYIIIILNHNIYSKFIIFKNNCGSISSSIYSFKIIYQAEFLFILIYKI